MGLDRTRKSRNTQHEAGEIRLRQSPVNRILSKLGSDTVR